jgi:hypothetical protein
MHHNLHFVDQADGVSLTGSLPFEELAIIYANKCEELRQAMRKS